MTTTGLLILTALIIWNIIVFLFYAIDKYKAQHHLWRIPEKVLISQGNIGRWFRRISRWKNLST